MSAELHRKIMIGYIVIVAVIGGMVAAVVNERIRLQRMKDIVSSTNFARERINEAHLNVIRLATHGESVIVWDKEDFAKYHHNRLRVDSLLQDMKTSCSGFIRPEQIDSLCFLLKEKETHLMHIMEIIRIHEESDSLLVYGLPTARKEVSELYKETSRWHRDTDRLKPVVSSSGLSEINERLMSIHDRKVRQMESYTDSLRLRNKNLNIKLYDFVSFLDSQVQDIFAKRSFEMANAQRTSFYLFAFAISGAIVLLLVSFLVIRSDLKKEEHIRRILEKTIDENGRLLEMRKQIILTVSHDIRGPLGNIHNCAELIPKTREKKKREGYLENIRYSCRHILHLVNDLMDAYRFNEAGEVNDVPFRLDGFLQRVSDDFLRKANAKALIFKSAQKGSMTAVKGDPDKIEQILSNLLDNAIKFTTSGTIHFQSEYIKGNLHVEISDTGIGMDKEILERIYNPFERAAQNINSEGFGLGLFITKGLVDFLKGSIEVESMPGKGTCFYLDLPLSETDEPVEEPSAEQVFSILPRRVLVVDDDIILLKVTKDMLERNGIACTTCLNVREAVSALYKSDYDLVLTDVQMPVTDGFGLLELFRNSDIGNSRDIPVAVMTARGDGNTGVYTQSGFCGCLHKPFEMKDLLAFLSAMLVQNGYSEFDFSRLLENADDSEDMFSLIIKESEKDLDELEQGLDRMDRKAMRETIHRMMPAWEMLGRQDILLEFQKVLHDADAGPQSIRESCQKVTGWIRKLIVESKKKMDTNENSDSRG